jgi:hypothetical protein
MFSKALGGEQDGLHSYDAVHAATAVLAGLEFWDSFVVAIPIVRSIQR